MSMFDLQALESNRATMVAQIGQHAHELSMLPDIPLVIYERMQKLEEDIDAIDQKIRDIRVREMLDKFGIKGSGRFSTPPPVGAGASQAKRPKIEDRK